jgi:hypothetical protein
LIRDVWSRSLGKPNLDRFAAIRVYAPSKVRLLRDRRSGSPETAEARLKAIRRVFAHAIDNDLADRNPAKDVPYIGTGSQAFHSWTVEEVQQYEERHPKGTNARLALGLLLFTGRRRPDVVAFGRQYLRNGWLTFTQTKNRRNKPVTLSIPAIAEPGHELMALFWWKTPKRAAHYARTVDRIRHTARAIRFLDPEQKSAMTASPSPTGATKRPKSPRFQRQNDVMVPRGGIEPPTRGFSVRCSTN